MIVHIIAQHGGSFVDRMVVDGNVHYQAIPLKMAASKTSQALRELQKSPTRDAKIQHALTTCSVVKRTDSVEHHMPMTKGQNCSSKKNSKKAKASFTTKSKKPSPADPEATENLRCMGNLSKHTGKPRHNRVTRATFHSVHQQEECTRMHLSSSEATNIDNASFAETRESVKYPNHLRALLPVKKRRLRFASALASANSTTKSPSFSSHSQKSWDGSKQVFQPIRDICNDADGNHLLPQAPSDLPIARPTPYRWSVAPNLRPKPSVVPVPLTSFVDIVNDCPTHHQDDSTQFSQSTTDEGSNGSHASRSGVRDGSSDSVSLPWSQPQESAALASPENSAYSSTSYQYDGKDGTYNSVCRQLSGSNVVTSSSAFTTAKQQGKLVRQRSHQEMSRMHSGEEPTVSPRGSMCTVTPSSTFWKSSPSSIGSKCSVPSTVKDFSLCCTPVNGNSKIAEQSGNEFTNDTLMPPSQINSPISSKTTTASATMLSIQDWSPSPISIGIYDTSRTPQVSAKGDTSRALCVSENTRHCCSPLSIRIKGGVASCWTVPPGMACQQEGTKGLSSTIDPAGASPIGKEITISPASAVAMTRFCHRRGASLSPMRMFASAIPTSTLCAANDWISDKLNFGSSGTHFSPSGLSITRSTCDCRSPSVTPFFDNEMTTLLAAVNVEKADDFRDMDCMDAEPTKCLVSSPDDWVAPVDTHISRIHSVDETPSKSWSNLLSPSEEISIADDAKTENVNHQLFLSCLYDARGDNWESTVAGSSENETTFVSTKNNPSEAKSNIPELVFVRSNQRRKVSDASFPSDNDRLLKSVA